jgi:hypothetical protein
MSDFTLMGKNKKVKIALKKVSDGSLIAQGTLKLNKFASDPRTFTEVKLESGRGGCAVKVALDLIFIENLNFEAVLERVSFFF